MTYQPFSVRHQTRKPPNGLVRGQIPDEVRNWARLFIKGLDENAVHQLWGVCVEQLGIDPDLFHHEDYMADANYRNMESFLGSCEYDQFLNVCELSGIWLYSRKHPLSQRFQDTLGERLVRCYSAYRVGEDGLISDPGSQVSQQAIEQARALLRSPVFEGPDRQFQNALLALHSASSPNYEGAVADALNAVEGVARIVLGDSSITLGPAAAKIRDEKGLHSRLANSIQSLYQYASDEGGRHGLTGSPDVDRIIAEFCLHQAAASIVFLARLYGHEVVEGS